MKITTPVFNITSCPHAIITITMTLYDKNARLRIICTGTAHPQIRQVRGRTRQEVGKLLDLGDVDEALGAGAAAGRGDLGRASHTRCSWVDLSSTLKDGLRWVYLFVPPI